MKNIRKRIDGRWEFRKIINGKRLSIITNTQKLLLQKVKELNSGKAITYSSIKCKSFYELAVEWFDLFKKGKISNDNNYTGYINNYFNSLPIFKKSINKITFEELQAALNNIDKNRKLDYCFNIIRNVYKFALQKEIIKKDISNFLVKPKLSGKKGSWFNIDEQKLILDNLDKCNMKYELLFYLLVGCRREEAVNVKKSDINFEKNIIFVDGTKTKSAKRYVNISEEFKNILLKEFDNMFKYTPDYYSREFKRFLSQLKIENKHLHDLRHTFSSNLFYLGVPDKKRQYLMGHSSIMMTNDIYTTLDPTITKEDIIKLYNNLYPNF